MPKSSPSINLRGERDMINFPLNKPDLDNLGTERTVRFGELEGWKPSSDDSEQEAGGQPDSARVSRSLKPQFNVLIDFFGGGRVHTYSSRLRPEIVAKVVTFPSRASLRTRGIQPSSGPPFAFVYSRT
jgi:hypothetical protein